MSKLYMKQQVFTFVDRFTVKNEYEEDCYKVHGDFIVFGGKRLHIEDFSGNEVAMVKQKFLSIRPRFSVSVDGTEVAEIVKKFSLLQAQYYVNGPDWKVTGSVMDHDYSISDGRNDIVVLHKAWISWGDCYEIDIADGIDELLVLAVVIASTACRQLIISPQHIWACPDLITFRKQFRILFQSFGIEPCILPDRISRHFFGIGIHTLDQLRPVVVPGHHYYKSDWLILNQFLIRPAREKAETSD